MPPYDAANFGPPAPVATVTLRKLDGAAAVDGIELLIDSGADIPLLPRTALKRHKPIPAHQHKLRSKLSPLRATLPAATPRYASKSFAT